MSRDRDDEEKFLTDKMRAASPLHRLPADFAQRVTRAWLAERTHSAAKRRWPGIPLVLATVTVALGAIVLLWLGAGPRPFANQRNDSTRTEAPKAETKLGANSVSPESVPPPSLPAAAPRERPPYQPVSEENIKKMPDIDSDACGRSIRYPADATRLGIEGDVILRVELEDTGRVHGIRVLSGLGHGLDEAAVFALTHNCKFTPAIGKSGAAVAFVIPRYVFHFEPPSASKPNETTATSANAPAGQGRACSANKKCPAGLECIANGAKSTCEIICETNTDCPEDQRCVADAYGQVCRHIIDGTGL